MAEQSYAIDVEHPPSAVLRLVNPMLSFLLRTPLAGPARKQLMVLSFTGRKTGRPYSIPVSAHLIDHDLYALTGAPWKQNFRDGADAKVVYDGKTTAMSGELICDRAVVLFVTRSAHSTPSPRSIVLGVTSCAHRAKIVNAVCRVNENGCAGTKLAALHGSLKRCCPPVVI